MSIHEEYTLCFLCNTSSQPALGFRREVLKPDSGPAKCVLGKKSSERKKKGLCNSEERLGFALQTQTPAWLREATRSHRAGRNVRHLHAGESPEVSLDWAELWKRLEEITKSIRCWCKVRICIFCPLKFRDPHKGDFFPFLSREERGGHSASAWPSGSELNGRQGLWAEGLR